MLKWQCYRIQRSSRLPSLSWYRNIDTSSWWELVYEQVKRYVFSLNHNRLFCPLTEMVNISEFAKYLPEKEQILYSKSNFSPIFDYLTLKYFLFSSVSFSLQSLWFAPLQTLICGTLWSQGLKFLELMDRFRSFTMKIKFVKSCCGSRLS